MDSANQKIIPFPNELFFREVKTLLDQGQQVRITVKGRSMRPFLQDGDTVVLAPASIRPIRWGMIVVARTDLCGIVLHRVVLISKDKIWLMGDAHTRQCERTTKKDVMATVVAAYRNSKELKLNSFGLNCARVLWFLLLPFRGYLLRLYERLNQKK
jgi:phage repressor protein C with HTH and peptisase S24 domain